MLNRPYGFEMDQFQNRNDAIKDTKALEVHFKFELTLFIHICHKNAL